MPIDATKIFESYREAARHLRNTCFLNRESGDWGIIEDFEAVNDILFERMVPARIHPDHAYVPLGHIKENKFLIEPSGSGMTAMISRDAPAKGCWNHQITMLFPIEAVLAFREYFDWDSHGLIDFRYYRVTIIASDKYPELVGHEALIETNHAKVINQE